MAITNCPMCQSVIPAGETRKTCAQCGADLSRWVAKGPGQQSMPVQIEPFQGESSRAARNVLYCVAAVWAIPFSLLVVAATKYSLPLDSVNLTLGGAPIVLCIMAVIAALKCGAGKKSGRIWAFLPVWVLIFCFPIGTIVGYIAHTRLSEAELN